MTKKLSNIKAPLTNPSVLLATGLGFGLSPVAPGTVGTLWGILLVGLVRYFHASLTLEIAIAVVLSVLAIPLCAAAENVLKMKDDRRIVADEYMTFPLCMIALPFTPQMLAFAFVTNRICDIVKPPPAYQFQSLKGGWGIVLDDVMAALYSLGINWLAFSFFADFFSAQ